MQAKVKITLYPDKIRKLQEIAQKAFELTVDEVLTDIRNSQTVPKNTGELGPEWDRQLCCIPGPGHVFQHTSAGTQSLSLKSLLFPPMSCNHPVSQLF